MAFKMTGFSGFKQTERSQGKTTKPVEGKKELSAYEKAFAAARAAGKDTFTFEGELHNTLYEGESGVFPIGGGMIGVQDSTGKQAQYSTESTGDIGRHGI